MEKISLDRITLLDLNGRAVELSTLVHELTLLIFLRHLA